MHDYYVYLLASSTGTLYVGITRDLVWSRKKKLALVASGNPHWRDLSDTFASASADSA
jgi:predicted GIY-YIG superfamily endonuclease